MDWWWAYLAVGAFVGFFSGLLGIGGGSAMVPALAFIYAAKGFSGTYVIHLALGTCVAGILFTSASSAWSHHRHRAVNWGIFLQVVPGIIGGTFAGAGLARLLDARLLTIVFTALIFYAATLMILEPKPGPQVPLPGAGRMTALGIVVGLFSSLTATGGAAMVVAYLVRRNVTVHSAIGTAAALSWVLALTGTVSYVATGFTATGLPQGSLGFVYLPALAWIVAASMVMAPVGASIAHRTPGRTLKRIFAVVLYALAIGLLVRFF